MSTKTQDKQPLIAPFQGATRQHQRLRRALPLADAAFYCGISPSSFACEVTEGRAPQSLKITARDDVWLLDSLDEWIDRVAREANSAAAAVANVPGANDTVSIKHTRPRQAKARQRSVAASRASGALILPGSIAELLCRYLASVEFGELAATTRTDYRLYLNRLDARFGNLATLHADRQWLLSYRDESRATPRTANYTVSIVGALFAWAIDRELFKGTNPATRIRPLKGGERHRTWTPDEIAAMCGPGAGDVALPVMLAISTAQRLGDVLAMTWGAYEDGGITVKQSKTGTLLVLPVSDALAAVLAAERARQGNPPPGSRIAQTKGGRPWRTDWFKHRFAEARADLGLPTSLHFHGLRHTAATALAEAGATHSQIKSVTGHKTDSMVTHYIEAAQQRTLAQSAAALGALNWPRKQ